jgi:hypothetical protein
MLAPIKLKSRPAFYNVSPLSHQASTDADVVNGQHETTEYDAKFVFVRKPFEGCVLSLAAHACFAKLKSDEGLRSNEKGCGAMIGVTKRIASVSLLPLLMGLRALFNLDEEFGMLILIFRRMTPQERAVFILGRPPDRVEFVISHHCFCCAGVTHGARNSQDLPLLRAAIYKIADEDHLPFPMPESTLDFGVVERA